MNFTQISRETMSDVVVNQIIDKIICGELKVADRLPTEKELGERMGVGRSTIREALKSLEVMGLLTRQKTGTEVADLKNGIMVSLMQCFTALKNIDVQDLIELRLVLEPAFTSVAAQRATPEDVANLHRILDELEQIGDEMSNIGFHEYIVHMTGNAAYQLVYQMLMPTLRMLRNRAAKGHISASGINFREHYDILDAIAAHDADKAAELMRHHLREIGTEMKEKQPDVR